MVQTDLAEKKEKRKKKKKKKILLEVKPATYGGGFHVKKKIQCFHVGCANQSHKDTMNTMISSIVAINSMLHELRDGLIEKGHALQELLEVKHPDADAVLVAVEKITFLLQGQPVNISNQWVTARTRNIDGKKNLSQTIKFVG